MGSRRAYPTAEYYDERERDFYGGGGRRSQRDFEELDQEIRGPRTEYSVRRPGPQPDFLREDYGRTSAGPLVVSERRTQRDDWSPPPLKPRKEVERDEIIIRDRKSERPPPSRSSHSDRDEIIFRRDAPPPKPRSHVDREEITFRREERSPPRPPKSQPPREREREEIIFRHEERSPPPPRPKPREVDREEIVFRRGEGARSRPPPSEADREEIRIRRHEGPPPSRGGPREVEKEEISIRRTESEGPPRHRAPSSHRDRGDLVAREKEEFVIRRRPPPPSPPPPEKQEIIIRRTERSPSPELPPSPPPPPPPPEPIMRPPIVQEIITHHRHIDHGVERARSPTPPPPPPSPPKDETLEISIRNRRGENGKSYDEDIIFERDVKERKPAHSHDDMEIVTRRRSVSAPRRKTVDEWDIDAEADYYNRKAMERAYIGEAHNGATKDWAIVDVPPGTNRVKMEGVGGGRQEVTWQRYNGVRRSKFLADDREYASDWGAPTPAPPPLPAPPKHKPADMWTEITKDLVIKEAIDVMGYDYEETDYFFYVMDYLRYEDVLQLVEISDDIRRERRQRIREIEYERKKLEAPPPKPPKEYDYYEREVIYERDDRRGRYR
ncbi:hypothetical protein GTA08_BOTSDO12324 [Botryosphaeria dothidea]|uniref:DUF8035 domain-containing protein n=1 Tax=Botryosphaeria dothidea TaxID=55169 RepID=A0A8H4N984_9PEZI|nr:hypothetical protein GTA08_BOTSDO12324 [Botryosphaeria dothidea]